MTLPVINVVRPSSLAYQSNGKLDPSLLVYIHPRGRLHYITARAWTALVNYCGQNGLPLTFIYGGCYRTYDEQKQLFLSRYTTTYLAGRPTKYWNGNTWYLRVGMSPAATPGTSNHGWGLGIDAAFDRDPSDGLGPDDATSITSHPEWSWFVSIAGQFGFCWEMQSEPWHINYYTGDNIPQAVLDYETGTVPPPPPPDPGPEFPPFDPANGLFSLYPLATKATIRLGARGDLVKYLQGVLRVKLGYNIGIDGYWGPVTNNFVIWFQTVYGLYVDGICGPKTWAVIDTIALGG